MIVIIIMWMIGYFFTLLFLCGTNFKAYWVSSETEETECLPTKPVHLGYAISDVITDVLVILLPIPEVQLKVYYGPIQKIDKHRFGSFICQPVASLPYRAFLDSALCKMFGSSCRELTWLTIRQHHCYVDYSPGHLLSGADGFVSFSSI